MSTAKATGPQAPVAAHRGHGTTAATHEHHGTFAPGHDATEADLAKAPGHWVLARMGKRVLRPGGLELTRRMIEALGIGPEHHVVEFAPGLGGTAAMVLDHKPKSYTGIDRDATVVERLQATLGGPGRRFLTGQAAGTDLPPASADRVYGEAMLTMHADHRKQEIIREAHRILRPGGLYAIHELGLQPDTLPAARKATVQRDLATAIRVNARPLTAHEWQALLEAEGFTVLWVGQSPMRLLEPGRMIADEGLAGALRITWNILRNPAARQRVQDMRHVFQRHRASMNAVAIVAARS